MTEPVSREVLVNASADRAFGLFTSRIGTWWPLDRHAVFGDGTVAFEGSNLVERSGDRMSVWGEVLEWDPPSALTITWHPGYDAAQASEVRVTFVAVDAQTLVTLVHSGWERMADPDAAAHDYEQGWPIVLDRYREVVEAAFM